MSCQRECRLGLAASDSSDDESEEQDNVRKAPFDVVVSKDGVVVRESADRDKAGAFRSFMSVKNCFTETQRQGTRKKGGEYFFRQVNFSSTLAGCTFIVH